MDKSREPITNRSLLLTIDSLQNLVFLTTPATDQAILPASSILHISIYLAKETPCGVHTDTTRHFLAECDIKWTLWKLVLQHYFPSIGISSDMLYKSIRKLKLPPNVRDAKYYFSVISTTLYQLCILYWQHGDNNISTYPLIQIQTSSSRIITRIERLLHSTAD